jgi:hypothetical protein
VFLQVAVRFCERGCLALFVSDQLISGRPTRPSSRNTTV